MAAIENFRKALQDLQLNEAIIAEIMAGYETISDKDKKGKRAEFFITAMQRADRLLDFETRRDLRDACACSKGGWRLKAVQKIAQEYADKSLEEKIRALGQVTYMGKPALNDDGTITAGIGDEGGFECPCPIFNGSGLTESISITYCYCCAGHFRFHYQIALGKKLITREVVSSALESSRTKPCRFVYEIVNE